MQGKGFSIDAVVGVLLKGYIQQPDFSAIRDEIEDHKAPGFCVLKNETYVPEIGAIKAPTWWKIMFTTAESVVVQELEVLSHT